MIFFKNKRTTSILFSLLFASAILFTSCLKDDDDLPEQDVAGFMGFNLSPDQPALGYKIDNSILSTNALGFGNYTGSYLPIYEGQRRIEAFNFGTGATLDSLSRAISTDKFYTAFLFGQDGNYRLNVVDDGLEGLQYVADKAYLRLVNGYTDTTLVPSFTYEVADSVVYSENLVYRSVGAFVPVSAGSIDVRVQNGADSLTSRTIAIDAGKIYTILLLIKPETTATTPEIKFVVNGLLTP